MWTKAKYVFLAGMVAVLLVLSLVSPGGWLRGAVGCRPYDAELEVAWRQDRRNGFQHMDRGRYREAEDKFRAALPLVEEQYGPEHEQVIKTINALGAACLMQGNRHEAEVQYRRALHLSEKVYEDDDPNRGLPLLGLYQIAVERGRYATAVDYAKQRLEIAEAAFGKSDPRLVDYLKDVHNSYAEQERFRKAIPIGERMVELLRLRSDGPDRRLGITLSRLAYDNHALGKCGDAKPLYERSLEILDRVETVTKKDRAFTAVLRNYCQLLFATNRPGEASAVCERYHRN